MRDLVVLLPGITGSVLQKDNEDLWAVSGQSLWAALRDRKDRLEALKVPDHKPGETPPDDGIRATRLIYDFHGVFGLWKIDGYNTMARLITDNFEVTPGDPAAPHEDQNFFEFPYDWRRSNRDSACMLQKFVEQQLHNWRRWSHWKDAKVILLAHSMGGLVSRYYLEVLEGWRDCRALLTFGTPYRGSLNAVNYVSNGYKMAGIDFTDVMRTMPSIYELMPIYPAVNLDGRWQRVAESDSLPKVFVKEKAADALRFHREIEEAVNQHRDSIDYLKNGYSIMPVVGIQQPTLQSAFVKGGKLFCSESRPAIVDELQQGGDGTVPRISATPIELGNQPPAVHFVEIHGSLQNNPYILDNLRAQLQQLQVDPAKPPVRGVPLPKATRQRPAIGLHVEDLYESGQPVVLHAEISGPAAPAGGLVATFRPSHKRSSQFERPFKATTQGYELVVEGLDPGQYRVAVKGALGGPNAPTAVHEVFEITGAA
jgi:hypothetical protein